MPKKLLFLFLLIPALGLAQITLSPETFGVNQPVTITVDTESTATDCNGFNKPAKVYIHAGIGTDADPWSLGVVGNWGQDDGVGVMTDNGDGSWSITLTPQDYFGLDATQAATATQMGLVFRNADGSQEMKASGCADFTIAVGSFQMTRTSPMEDTTLLQAGETLSIVASASEAAEFTLYANGTAVDTQSNTSQYSYDFSVTENTTFNLSATASGETQSQQFQALVTPTVVEAPVPAGMLDGINLDANDPTTATLVLYAPNKSFVHLIGDFNNWQIDNAYLMQYDSTADRFWITLNGLIPQQYNGYQYLVDYEINIADPYATLILDPYNDQYIEETTYPNLPDYPTGKTTEAVSVFRTGETPYAWQTPNFEAPAKEDLIIYELLIRDFDSAHSFKAVQNRLDYLQGLGINAIELMPVSEFDGNESWGYNPSFHMALDKYYGTAEAFKTFIDACHARGIAVILDVVYNHATGQHPYFRLWNDSNGGLGGQATAENPFFNIQATHSYSVFNDFNHQSQATRDYVARTAQYWIEEFKVDGFRWDLTKGFTQNCSASDENCTNTYQADRVAVLQEYADAQWAVDDDFYIIFEHLGGIDEEKEWAEYRQDEGLGILLWNKLTDPYNETTMGYHNGSSSNFNNVSYKNKGFSTPAAVSYMESHDEERLMFKNLEFGNASGDYSVKDLNTALNRMEAAGAFFFTVPGPKILWQFGELGYDISIEYNGRVGNKPILWDYADDPNRKAVYNSWAKLIEMRLDAPIFQTTDFIVDANSSTGLKKIQLSYAQATGSEIKYITILGNFGVEAQDITPDFQTTGTWYNLMDRNRPQEVSDVSTPISLAAGEFLVLGDQPFVFANDMDSDGVPNTDDQCPDTPLGATVDVNGCPIYDLPADNFTLTTTNTSCIGNDNGQILVAVAQLMSYTVTVSGPNGFTHTDSFDSDQWRLENLAGGSYTLCFTVAGQADYEQCFTTVVSAPEPLSVYALVNTTGKQLNLNLKGGGNYQITLNGNRYETSSSFYTLPLKTGMNSLYVATDLECQGIHQQAIYLPEGLSFWPNPVQEQLHVLWVEDIPEVAYSIHSLSGRILDQGKASVTNDRKIRLSLGRLQSGQYLVRLTGQQTTQTLKIVKK